MRNFILVLFVIISMISASAACGYCHGNGRVKTHVGVSGFGINNDKFKCPHCGKWVYTSEDHWDICPQCHGNPDGGGHSSYTDSDDGDAVSNMYIRYLTADEYADWQNCIRLAMQGGTKMVTCDQCGGYKVCKLCNGSKLDPMQHPDDMEFFGMQTPCHMCGGTGNCLKCGGSGEISVPDESVKAMANQRLEYYRDLVNQRQNNPGSGGPMLDMTDYADGSDAGYSDDPYAEDDDYSDSSSSGRKKSSKSSTAETLGAIAVAGAVGFFLFRRFRK